MNKPLTKFVAQLYLDKINALATKGSLPEALVNARRRGLVEARCTVSLPGGDLVIEQREDGHVLMSGPVATSFKGELTLG